MNPVVLAVGLMLILSMARVHVVFSLIISAFIGGMVADIPAETILAAFPDAGGDHARCHSQAEVSGQGV